MRRLAQEAVGARTLGHAPGVGRMAARAGSLPLTAVQRRDIALTRAAPMAKLWGGKQEGPPSSVAKRPMLPGEFDVFGGDEANLDNKIMIDGYSPPGRFSVNGVLLPAPLFLLPNAVFEWRVSSLADLSPQSLALAYAVQPRVSILILGCGNKIKMIDPALRDFFRKKGISIEALDTWNAMATWNILNQEDRAVAAALLPFDVE